MNSWNIYVITAVELHGHASQRRQECECGRHPLLSDYVATKSDVESPVTEKCTSKYVWVQVRLAWLQWTGDAIGLSVSLQTWPQMIFELNFHLKVRLSLRDQLQDFGRNFILLDCYRRVEI